MIVDFRCARPSRSVPWNFLGWKVDVDHPSVSDRTWDLNGKRGCWMLVCLSVPRAPIDVPSSTDPESRCGIHPSTRKFRRITSREWLLWNPPAQRNTGSQHVTDRRVDTVQGAAQTGRTSDWLEARGKSSRTPGRKSLCMHECDCAPHPPELAWARRVRNAQRVRYCDAERETSRLLGQRNHILSHCRSAARAVHTGTLVMSAAW
jgi:hypothetical protein